MRILLLNQTFYPDIVATAQHLGDLAFHLAESGHEVKVLTSCRAYADPTKHFPSHEIVNGVEIERLPSAGLGKGAKWKRAVDFASFLVSAAVGLVKESCFGRKPDVVIALTTPPLVSVLGAYAARWWGARFVYWVMDLNPDEAVAAGWLKKGSLPEKGLEWLSRWSLHSATTIVALDEMMKQRLLAKDVSEHQVAVISPWSHDEDVGFDAAGRQSFRAEHGWSDKFVVMYSGNHSPCHPLDTLLEAAALLKDDERFLFAFVGGGSELAKVHQAREMRQLNNIAVLPYQPMERLAASLSSADAQVVVMGEPFVGLIHPCKVYNALTVGAPIVYIGPSPSHVTEALSECQRADTAIIVNHGESATLAEKLRALAKATPEALRHPVAGKDASFGQSNRLKEWTEVILGK